MADVFLAERLGDDGFKTRVALKRLHRGLAMDSYFIRQLVREARLLGQLEHANIVRVFDLRRIGDEYYVVMEFVDGRILRDPALPEMAPPEREAVYAAFFRTLAALHALDPAALGLSTCHLNPSRPLLPLAWHNSPLLLLLRD